MAGEYSRDLAVKCRVVSMGFQIGILPPLGYRRCSVSSDGARRRRMLRRGERKVALTDRVEWVLAPEDEVALVRRICSACASGMALKHIAGLVQAEGWQTERGKPVTTRSIKTLVSNEAFIGNFVWGTGGNAVRF